MKTGFYTADTINGVSFSGNKAPPRAEAVSPTDFYSMLKNVKEDAPICAFFGEEDRELLMKIESEYGVHQT
jgi:hypothetical protein